MNEQSSETMQREETAAAVEAKRLIWAIEDDPACQFVYQEVLGPRYDLQVFTDLKGFTDVLREDNRPRPDLVIADLRLPDGSFLSFISHTDHAELFSTPFIVVSSLDDENILRMCFAEGALDYITKPFGKGELTVKVERLLEAQAKKKLDMSEPVSAGGDELVINPTFFTITVGSYPPLTLTPKELQIMSLLQRAPQNTISRQDIIKSVWKEVKVGSKTLDVHLFNLRKKLQGLSYEIKHLPPNLYALVRYKGR